VNALDQECCPSFSVEKWDEKTFEWDRKPFLKDTLRTLFHIPFPPTIGKKITRMYHQAENAQVNMPDKRDGLVMFRDPSPFKSEIYYAVTNHVEGANNTTISGTFVAKVFDGPYEAVPKFIKEMNVYLRQQDKEAKDFYVHYAYCPKCAKKFQHNYMVLFAEV